MASDLDIYRSAKIMLDRHGDDAELRSSEKADAMLARGDMEGVAVWKRIIAAVGELRRGLLAPGEHIH